MANRLQAKRTRPSLKKSLPYGRQWINRQDINEVVRTLKSAWLTQGPAIPAFEQKLLQLTGARYAVAVSNGTAALHIACMAAGISNGDEVITSPLTFVASANAVLYCGGKPVFADITPHSGNIDPLQIETKIIAKTKAIIPVHYAGFSCDMERIHEMASKKSLIVIEDAAHALGAAYKGSPVGSCRYSDMTIFSFHPVKHITTGEGGAVLTNDKKLYEKLVRFRTHGITKENLQYPADGDWYYEMQSLGYNYRITDIQCALGLSQAKKLPLFVKKRRAVAAQYDKAFAKSLYLDVLSEESPIFSSYHLYPILLKEKYTPAKKEIFAELRKRGVGAQVHYIPVYLQPYYRDLGFKPGLCPQAEKFYRRSISIPMFPALTRSDVSFVVATVNDVLANIL